MPARRRGRLRRADAAHLRAAARQRPAARALPAPLPPRAGRRVPGHQQAAVRVAEDVRAAGRARWRNAAGRCSRSATTTRASTPSAARAWATWPTSSASTACSASSSWSRTTAASATSWTPPTSSSAHNAQRLGKNLRTDAGAGEPVRVFEATSDFAEAQWFLEEAQQLHRGGLPRSEIALLYRSNAQSRVHRKRALQRRRALPRLRRPALLRARRGQARAGLPAPAGEPQRRHQLPARGELPDARHRRAQHRAAAGRGAASGRSLAQSVGAVAGKAGANLQAFVALIDAMRAATQGLTLREIIDHVLQALGPARLLPHRQGRPGPHREPGGTGQRRRELRHPGRLRQGRGGAAGGRAGRAAGGATPVPRPASCRRRSRSEIMSPLAAFLTHAALEAGDNQAQAGPTRSS